MALKYLHDIGAQPYDPQLPAGSYTSLAHGWSTGPTGALTYDVLGITPTSPGGRRYAVIPHPGDLAWADGRLRLPAGAVTVAWQYTASGFTLTVTDDEPRTQGTIALPRLGGDRTVYIDGIKAWDGTQFLGASGVEDAEQDGTYVTFHGVRPGTHTFTWMSR